MTKALGDDAKTQKHINDSRHTYTNCKNNLEHSNIKAAALMKEVVELKRVSSNGPGYDTVATLQLQHQTALFDSAFKLKNAELEFFVAVRLRKEAEVELAAENKTVEKFRS